MLRILERRARSATKMRLLPGILVSTFLFSGTGCQKAGELISATTSTMAPDKTTPTTSPEAPSPDETNPEPSSSINLELTEITVNRDTVPAGQTIQIEVITKNAVGAKASFKNTRIQVGLRDGSSLGSFADVIAQGQGRYSVEFTARRAGTPTEIEVLINGVAPRVRSPRITVVPGLVSLSQSLVTVTPSEVRAGSTTQVVLRAMDLMGNQLLNGGLNVSFALNGGSSSGEFGPVTDHQDGTYSATFTGRLAGGPSPVTGKINEQGVLTPHPAVTVRPGTFSAEKSELSITSPTVRSGESVEIKIEARDIYGNKLSEGGEAFSLALQAGSSTGSFGPIRDLGNGTYSSLLTGWRAGEPTKITASSKGQALGSSVSVTVTPGIPDPARSQLSCATSKIVLGGSLVCTVTLRDRYDNPASSTETPTFSLREGGGSKGEFAPTQSPATGVYTSTFKATKDGTPSTVLASFGSRPITSSSPSIEVVFPSLAKSSLILDNEKISSGRNTQVRLQTRDDAGQPVSVEGLNVVFFAAGIGSSSVEIGVSQDRGGGNYIAGIIGQKSGTPISISAKINDRAFEGRQPSLVVIPGELSRIQIENAGDGSGRTFGSQNLVDGERVNAFLVGRDAAGNFVSALRASQWSLSDSRHGSLSDLNGEKTELIANRAATGNEGLLLQATYPGPPTQTVEAGPFRIQNPLSSISGLLHWYRADSFRPLEKPTPVGDKSRPWINSAPDTTSNAFVKSSRRAPTFLPKAIDEKAAVRFTGAQRLRIPMALERALSDQDLTIFAIIAREEAGENHLFWGKGERRNSLILGWTEKNRVRFGYRDDDEKSMIHTVPTPFAKGQWELITALADHSSRDGIGLSLYINGAALEIDRERRSESGEESEKKANKKSDDDEEDEDDPPPHVKGREKNQSRRATMTLGGRGSSLLIGDLLIYNRILEKTERCKVQIYLKEKYSLSVSDICP